MRRSLPDTMSSGHRIKISSNWKPEAGKLVPDEKQRKKKQAVCARFPKRKNRIRYKPAMKQGVML